MTESIALDVHLQAFVRKDKARRWAAVCPLVGVASQGKTAGDARASLQEAVELWFESCVERGVLDQALPRRGKPRQNVGVLGEPFEIHLTIPAYEAATVLSESA
jgi:predicted RNase H-like HicB family nuclease